MIDHREVQKRMEKLDDASLRRLVFLEQSDYLPGAVEIARGELVRRGIPVLTPEDYWHQFRDEWMESIGFCYRCWAETTDESAGQSMTLNFVGQRLIGSEDPCEVCGSVVQTKWFCVIAPLVRIGRYRVIPGPRNEYIGRKLKNQAAVVDQS